MGGSQGARSINDCAIEAFAEREGRDFHVVHLAGRRDYEELRAALAGAPHRERYTLLEYEPDLGDCLAACDLVLGRSGGSIFEVAAAGRPAILVPYPHATADHQSANAAWMAEAGAAVVIEDAEMSAARLAAEVGALLGDEPRLAAMSAASAALAKPDAARRIADEVLAAAGAERRRAEAGDARTGRRRLHFVGIGGAGMSGLALVCARLGATVTGSDRADSSYMERLREAGLEPVVGHDAANLPDGAEVVVSTAIGEDNPELAAARERGVEPCPPRRAARRALRREAADRGRRHPRQDDDDRDAGLGAAGDRRRPRLLRRRRGPRARRRMAAPPTPAGARGSGSSPRPTRATAASSS